MEINRRKEYKKAIKDTLIYYRLTEYRAIEKYFNGMMEILQREFGYFLMEVNEETGIILCSPEGQEIYREIPKTEGWMYNTLKALADYED